MHFPVVSVECCSHLVEPCYAKGGLTWCLLFLEEDGRKQEAALPVVV